MSLRMRRVLLAGAIGASIGFGYPLVELLIHCRAPASEGCVWGKAYLPFSLGLGAAVALIIGSVAYFIMGLIAPADSSSLGDQPPK